MTTIYLHIGFHKTGSTSLQSLLRANRAALAGRIGILVQGDEALRGLEKACLFYDRRPGPTRAAAIGAAWAAIVSRVQQGPDVWILSTEDVLGRIPSGRDQAEIYAHAPDILALLATKSLDVDLLICAFLRAPADWVDSIHRHLVRTRGLAMTTAAFAALPKFSVARDPLADAARHIDAVLPAPMHRFTLEEEASLPLGPGTGLLRLAGLREDDLAKLAPVPRQNEGLDRAILARMSTPTMRLLPRLIRRMMIKRMIVGKDPRL